MTYFILNGVMGYPAITAVSSTRGVPAGGEIVRARDSTYGVGEFIYLLGVASTLVGSAVTYNATTWQTALSPTANTGNSSPLAVAMAANAGGQWGWYQVTGLAVIKKTAVAIAPQVQLAVSGTAGRLYATYSTGKGIEGAKSANLATVASATSTVVVLLSRPSIEAI